MNFFSMSHVRVVIGIQRGLIILHFWKWTSGLLNIFMKFSEFTEPFFCFCTTNQRRRAIEKIAVTRLKKKNIILKNLKQKVDLIMLHEMSDYVTYRIDTFSDLQILPKKYLNFFFALIFK